MNKKLQFVAIALLGLLVLLFAISLMIPAQNLLAQGRPTNTPTPNGIITPGPSPTHVSPKPQKELPTPSRMTDLAPNVAKDNKITVVVRHPDGSYEGLLLPWEKFDNQFIQSLPSGDTVVSWAPPHPLTSMQPPAPELPTIQAKAATLPETMTSSACTQNPSSLSFRVSQQPSKSLALPMVGTTQTFYVEGTGFIPGEKVTVIIKGRVAAPGTMGSTDELVGTDSTFATTVAAVVIQPNMPFDLFVIHRRGVSCAILTATQ